MEIVKQLGFRAAAGLDSAEIAAQVEAHRSELKHLQPPPGRPISALWVNSRFRELRQEIAERAVD